MKETTNEELGLLSQMHAFLGNSLLRPMNQTKGPGLDPEFWAALPDFGSARVEAALDDLFTFARAAQARMEAGEDVATEVSVEYTRLFVGPPSPAAVPWETYYPEGPEGEEMPAPASGFGGPTFAMRALLREAGLELANENRQFEDHIGIELLYLSELCRRASEGDAEAEGKIAPFVAEHPNRWIGRLAAKVSESFPEGYVIRLLALTQALLAL